MQSDAPNEPQNVAGSDQKSVTVSVESPAGAMYHALHVSRTVKTYPIQEHELLALDDLGGNSTLWTAIGTAATTFLANCIWDACKIQPSAVMTSGVKGFMLLLLIVALASFGLAWSYRNRRKSRLEKIMGECES